MVEVYRARGEAEARIIQGLLESHGIPCLLKSDLASSVHAFAAGMGEIKIMVWKSMVDKAREFIVGEEND